MCSYGVANFNLQAPSGIHCICTSQYIYIPRSYTSWPQTLPFHAAFSIPPPPPPPLLCFHCTTKELKSEAKAKRAATEEGARPPPHDAHHPPSRKIATAAGGDPYQDRSKDRSKDRPGDRSEDYSEDRSGDRSKDRSEERATAASSVGASKSQRCSWSTSSSWESGHQQRRTSAASSAWSSTTASDLTGDIAQQVSTSTTADGINTIRNDTDSGEGFIGSGLVVEQMRGAARGSSASTIDTSRSAIDDNNNSSSEDALGGGGHHGNKGLDSRGQYQKRDDVGGKGDSTSGSNGASSSNSRSSRSSSSSYPERNPAASSGSTRAYHYHGGNQAATEKEMEIEEVDVDDFCLDEELEHVVVSSTDTRLADQGAEQERDTARRGAPTTIGSFRPDEALCGGGGGGGGASANPNEAGTGKGAGKQGIGRIAVTEVEASGVRELVFGDGSKAFNEAWREQGFFFCGVDGLGYGLVQAEGGPCGVLAVVQAFLLEVWQRSERSIVTARVPCDIRTWLGCRYYTVNCAKYRL